MSRHPQFPRVIFGTSSLGNLYREVSFETKKAIVEQVVANSPGIPVFDSAGKYGAGLSLETLGQALQQLEVPPDQVLISNKLGWKRVPLTAAEPTFEPGAWVNIRHDAVQSIGYDAIVACHEQGNQLLGDYSAGMVSVHDPDEYLAGAANRDQLESRKGHILDAYRALAELKASGAVSAIGVGAKHIDAIDFISDHVQLDWAMFACTITPYTHSLPARALLNKLSDQGVAIINSAVFNAGFLIGGDHFDYHRVSRASHPALFDWRDRFYAVCAKYDVAPAAACVQFSFLFKQIGSVALNTSSPSRVKDNIQLASADIPQAFWQSLEEEGLIDVTLQAARPTA